MITEAMTDFLSNFTSHSYGHFIAGDGWPGGLLIGICSAGHELSMNYLFEEEIL